MTHKELDEKFAQAVKAETTLTYREKSALASMYHNMLSGVELGVDILQDIIRISGALLFCKMCGKILDDEGPWMLISEIEEEAKG